jgi:hypothetical protein
MASNPFITQAAPMTSQVLIDPDSQALQRQKQYAAMLMQQNQPPQGQMVSGRYVAPSFTQQLSSAINPLVGAYMANQADTKQAELVKQLRQEGIRDIGQYMSALQGTPETITQQQATEGNLPQGQTMLDDQGQRTLVPKVTPAVGPDYNKALAIALNSRNPMAQALGASTIAEMTKPQKLGADEQLVRFNPQSQKYETIGAGAPKATNEFKNYQEAVKGGFKGSFMDFQVGLRKAGAQNVVLNTEKSYGQAFGQGLAGNDVKLYDSASRAPQMLETVKETRALLDNDKLYVGFGANQKLDLARAADAFGITGRDTADKISNTQRLFANRAQATLDSVKESGLGAGNGFTDKDREFLEKSKLGNIVYSRDALKQQLDIEERVARGLAQKWNTRFGQIPESAKGPTGVTRIELTKSIVEGLNPQDREAYEWATKNPNDARASQIMRRLGF